MLKTHASITLPQSTISRKLRFLGSFAFWKACFIRSASVTSAPPRSSPGFKFFFAAFNSGV